MVFLLFIIIFILLALVFSNIKVEIDNFNFSSETKKHINDKYKIIFKWCVFYKLPILKISITKDKIERLKNKDRIKRQFKNFESKVFSNKRMFNKKMIGAIKKVKLEILNMDLSIKIGTNDAGTTSILVPIIATILSICIKNKIKLKKNYEEIKYIIKPDYSGKNNINVEFSGIFQIKLIHIINIIYILNKKKGVKKIERASNTKPYEYGYE